MGGIYFLFNLSNSQKGTSIPGLGGEKYLSFSTVLCVDVWIHFKRESRGQRISKFIQVRLVVEKKRKLILMNAAIRMDLKIYKFKMNEEFFHNP